MSARHVALLAAVLTGLSAHGDREANAQQPTTSATRAVGRGVVVVALGAGSTEAAKVLARDVYGDDALRPGVDEATARVLCGLPPTEGAAPAIDELAALRASLDPDPAHPATRRALESVAAQLGATGVLAVHVGADAAPRALLVRVGAAGAPAVELVGSTSVGGPSWPGATASLRALIGVAAPVAAPPIAPTPTPPPIAAPLATRPGAQPVAQPVAQPSAGPAVRAAPAGAPAAEEPPAFWERPWFWVALGAFTVAGVTALVVSQTGGDEESGDSVRFRATIPQGTVPF